MVGGGRHHPPPAGPRQAGRRGGNATGGRGRDPTSPAGPAPPAAEPEPPPVLVEGGVDASLLPAPTLGHHLLRLLKFYGSEFDPRTTAVSAAQCRFVPAATSSWDPLTIPDPSDAHENVGRNAFRFFRCIERTHWPQFPKNTCIKKIKFLMRNNFSFCSV